MNLKWTRTQLNVVIWFLPPWTYCPWILPPLPSFIRFNLIFKSVLFDFNIRIKLAFDCQRVLIKNLFNFLFFENFICSRDLKFLAPGFNFTWLKIGPGVRRHLWDVRAVLVNSDWRLSKTSNFVSNFENLIKLVESPKSQILMFVLF